MTRIQELEDALQTAVNCLTRFQFDSCTLAKLIATLQRKPSTPKEQLLAALADKADAEARIKSLLVTVPTIPLQF